MRGKVRISTLNFGRIALAVVVAAGALVAVSTPSQAVTITVTDADCANGAQTGAPIIASPGDVIVFTSNLTGCTVGQVPSTLAPLGTEIGISVVGGGGTMIVTYTSFKAAGASPGYGTEISSFSITLGNTLGTYQISMGDLDLPNIGTEPLGNNRTSWSVTIVPPPEALPTQFTFLLPDGRECTSISPMPVQIGSSVALPGRDALCQTMSGASVRGWTIPVELGFTGVGSSSSPLQPGQVVQVTGSQQFTVVPYEPVLSFTYDANVGPGVECVATDAPNSSDDSREMSVWVPRADVSIARFPNRASCVPVGHELAGWNTAGDGSGEIFNVGAALPTSWEQYSVNRRVMFAMWKAA